MKSITVSHNGFQWKLLPIRGVETKLSQIKDHVDLIKLQTEEKCLIHYVGVIHEILNAYDNFLTSEKEIAQKSEGM